MLDLVLRSVFYFFVRDWRDRYQHRLAIFGELISFVLSLTVYWYTARAFAGATAFAGGDYFGYVVRGEASLLLPLGIVAGLLRAAREAHGEGVLEAMLVLPWSGTRTLLVLGTPCVLREGARALALLLAAAALGAHLSASQLAGWCLLEAAAVPVFTALGIACVALYLRYGRGEAAIGFGTTVAAILAGTYFPPTLFPETVQRAAQALSPFNVLLAACRAVTAPGGAILQAHALGQLALWSVALFPLACLAVASSLGAVRRRGCIEIC